MINKMNKLISILGEQPKGALAENNWWKYGFLSFVLFLALAQCYLLISSSEKYDYSGIIVPMMLIFNHLAAWFKFGPKLTVLIRIASLLWVIFGSIYIFSNLG